MPPKKKSKVTESSSSTASYDRRRFVSAAAEERYRHSVVHRNCIPERGFDNLLTEQIESLGWTTLALPPRACYVPLVKEFYANAKEHLNFKVFVRGRWVKFDSVSINAFYNTPDIPDDDYSRLRNEGVDPDILLDTLTQEGTEWKSNASTVTNFPAAKLELNCKVWHHFIIAKLIPSSNLCEVTRERATLNYAIQLGNTIDVGRVIQNSILRILASATGNLGHPSLIHELCVKAGVTTRESEEVLHPKPPLTRQLRSKMSTHNCGASSSQPSQPTTPTHTSQPGDPTRDILRRLERMNLRNTQWQEGMTLWKDSMQDQFNQLQRSIYDHFQYQNECFAALASAHPGITIPAPPQLPAQPHPPAPPDDHEDI